MRSILPDAFCAELIERENRDAIQGLLLAGYTPLITQLEAADAKQDEGNKSFRDQMLQFAVSIDRNRFFCICSILSESHSRFSTGDQARGSG